MTRTRWMILALVLAGAVVSAATLGGGDGAGDEAADDPISETDPTAPAAGDGATPEDAATPSPAPTSAPTSDGDDADDASEPTPTPTPTPTATPEPPPVRLCVEEPDEYAARITRLELAIGFTLRDYPGTWGFSLHDVDCDTTASVNGDLVQYTASTGKLPFVIAVLRAVQNGRIEFDEVRTDLELVLRDSLDDNANNLVRRVTRDEVLEVLDIAGVSDLTRFESSWSDYFSTADDMTRLWASVLRGDQLALWWTDYLLTLASKAQVPPVFETFYDRLDMAGLQYGQKAGYAVSLGPPYYLVGSGFLRPADGSSQGVAATLVLTTSADLAEPVRRQVFPLVVQFAVEAVAEVSPTG